MSYHPVVDFYCSKGRKLFAEIASAATAAMSSPSDAADAALVSFDEHIRTCAVHKVLRNTVQTVQ